MLLAAHVAVGAAVSTITNNPFLAVPAAFASHYLIDCIPHWDPSFSKKDNKVKIIVIADLIIGILLSIALSFLIPAFIIGNHDLPSNAVPQLATFKLFGWEFAPLTAACCFAAALPDALLVPKLFYKINSRWFDWNVKLQAFMHNNDFGILGKLVHVATVFVFTLYSFRLLPNSDSPIFLQIILLMLFVVAILAILETFSEDKKEKILTSAK